MSSLLSSPESLESLLDGDDGGGDGTMAVVVAVPVAATAAAAAAPRRAPPPPPAAALARRTDVMVESAAGGGEGGDSSGVVGVECGSATALSARRYCDVAAAIAAVTIAATAQAAYLKYIAGPSCLSN